VFTRSWFLIVNNMSARYYLQVKDINDVIVYQLPP